MANPDTPHGLTFSHTVHGGPPRIEWFVGSSSNAIFKGEFVQVTSTHATCVVDPTTIPNDGILVGVAAAYVPKGTTTSMIPVYTDLKNTVFTIQVDDTTNFVDDSSSIIEQWATTRPATTFGSTVTGLSWMELDADAYGIGVGYILVVQDGGLVDMPNNSWDGAHQEVYVMVKELITRHSTVTVST